MKLLSFIFLNFLYFSYSFANIVDMNSFESNFKQTITNDQNSVITYEGKVFAKKGNTALWTYHTPVNKEIYFYDGKVIIIEPDLEQVIVSKLDKVPDILQILKNAKKISKNKLEATCCSNTYTIYLEESKIKKITYQDKLQNSVAINFFNQKVNQQIDNKIFTYKIPEGYDILKQ